MNYVNLTDFDNPLNGIVYVRHPLIVEYEQDFWDLVCIDYVFLNMLQCISELISARNLLDFRV